MTKHLTKSLVDHRSIRPAPQRVAKLAFHHTEGAFDVRPLVIVLKECLALKHEKVKQLLPESAFSSAVIDTERDKRNPASRDHGFKVPYAGIGLVAGHLADFE